MARAALRVSQREELLTRQHVKIRRNLKDIGFFYLSVVSAFVIVLAVFGYLSVRLKVVNMGYEISRVNESRAAEIEKNRRLKVEVMRLKSPERIEKIAREELGLAYPKGEQVVRVK